jgi:hypothetical protein
MTSCRQLEDNLWEAVSAQAFSSALEEDLAKCEPCVRCLRALSLAVRGMPPLREEEPDGLSAELFDQAYKPVVSMAPEEPLMVCFYHSLVASGGAPGEALPRSR